jgi:hypothetical protein
MEAVRVAYTPEGRHNLIGVLGCAAQMDFNAVCPADPADHPVTPVQLACSRRRNHL